MTRTAQTAELISKIHAWASELGFVASCDLNTAQLLSALAASKPGGRVLELGTGVGLGTAMLLAGMDAAARLDTVEMEGPLSAAAQDVLGHNTQVHFHVSDGAVWLHAHA
jgi:predicted O-methyltransferase YrrM